MKRERGRKRRLDRGECEGGVGLEQDDEKEDEVREHKEQPTLTTIR